MIEEIDERIRLHLLNLESKICRTCDERKPHNQFGKSRLGKDGYNLDCKNCEKDRSALRRKENEGKSKECILCHKVKPVLDFPAHGNNKDGYEGRCRDCDSALQRERKYNWPDEEYKKAFEKQGGLCAICQCKPIKKALHGDHNHKTGKRRGLLCFHCNTTLGKFNDSIDLLKAAIAYLEEYDQPIQDGGNNEH